MHGSNKKNYINKKRIICLAKYIFPLEYKLLSNYIKIDFENYLVITKAKR
jgi:hypothetical protein